MDKDVYVNYIVGCAGVCSIRKARGVQIKADPYLLAWQVPCMCQWLIPGAMTPTCIGVAPTPNVFVLSHGSP